MTPTAKFEKQNQYAVSLVYCKHDIASDGVNVKSSLRATIVSAVSDDEALGKAMKEFAKDLDGFSLHLHCTIKISKSEFK